MVGGITTYLCNQLIASNVFLVLLLKGLICVIVPNLIYLIIYYNSKEFQYLLSTFSPLLNSMILKAQIYLRSL